MNIIDLLLNDHDKLRKNLVDIGRNIATPQLKHQLRNFISRYEMHESIEEDILFPAVEKALLKAVEKNPLPDYRSSHEKTWELLDKLVDALSRPSSSKLHQAYFIFSAAAEAHFRREERELFPLIRNNADENTLKRLGEKADKRIACFTA